MLSHNVYTCLGLDFLTHVRDHAVYVVDPAGRVVFWNQGATDLFGWEEKEMISDRLSSVEESVLFLPDDRGRGECDRERVRAVGEGVVMRDRWYQRRDGSRFVGDTTLLPLYDEKSGARGGAIRWFVRMVSDVTDRELRQVEIETSLNHQRRVMRRLEEAQLPVLDTFPGLQVAALYRPLLPEDRVGGDLYDAVPLEDGGVAFFVGDASGKGLVASARATEVRHSLRAYLREDPDPARAVSRVNDMLCRCASLERREAGMFATLTLAVVYPERETARLVHAGGEYPLLLGAGGEIRESFGDECVGLALGIAPDQTYTSTEIPLRRGDCLLLFTDGITESRRGREFFGTSGIADAVREARDHHGDNAAEARAVAETVMERAMQFHAAPTCDDMCVMSVRLTR